MISHIPNTGQLGNLLGQRFLDTIFEGDTDSTAALTPPPKRKIAKLSSVTSTSETSPPCAASEVYLVVEQIVDTVFNGAISIDTRHFRI